ncbi:MAG: hypothetical protein M1812_005987 [Candelaria pacifica]|nr:MAG: hypothetical protein M1812_005987 [Candelaria pacifica]
MGRELQKKKNRSSISKVKHKPKSKKHPVRGNAIVAANWNQSQTLSQNYHRLGLTRKLNSLTGGTEPHASNKNPTTATQKDAFPITNKTTTKALIPSEAQIERDPNTGFILRVLHTPSSNPLNDPLNDISDTQATAIDTMNAEPAAERTGIIALLEQQASFEKKKPPRKQSEMEKEWIGRLVSKWGTDILKMSRDMELNPMQQSEGDIRRRVERWHHGQ